MPLSTRKRRITVVLSSTAVLTLLGIGVRESPRILPATAAQVEQSVLLLKAHDSVEAAERVRQDAQINSTIDTLTLGLKFLVCRAAEQDKPHGSPATCSAILRDVTDFYKEVSH